MKPTEFHSPSGITQKTLQSKKLFASKLLLRDDHETKHMFSSTATYFIQTRKNIGNFLTGRAIRSDKQSGTFKFALPKCKTCPHIYNMLKTLGPNRSAKITDHFTCISIYVIYYITCKPCQKIYIGKTRQSCLDIIGVSRTSLRVLKERQMEATKRAVERTDDISHPNQVFSLKAKYKYKPFNKTNSNPQLRYSL